MFERYAVSGKEDIKIKGGNHLDRSLCFTHIQGKLRWSTCYFYAVVSQDITTKKDF